MGAGHSTTCWGEHGMGNCDMEAGVYSVGGWNGGGKSGPSSERQTEEIWAAMPVTALKVLESDRIDPWSRPGKGRNNGRNGCCVGGRHEKVVADTMGPEVVMMHRKRSPSKGAQQQQQQQQHRASNSRTRGRGRQRAKDGQGSAQPPDQSTIYLNSKFDEGPGRGLAGAVAQRGRWESSDEEFSDESEGECDLTDPNNVAMPSGWAHPKARPRRKHASLCDAEPDTSRGDRNFPPEGRRHYDPPAPEIRPQEALPDPEDFSCQHLRQKLEEMDFEMQMAGKEAPDLSEVSI